MILFFVSAFLLGAIGGAAVGFSKFGPTKTLSPLLGWAMWLSTVVALFAATYAMSIPIYAYLIEEHQFYLGLGAAAIAYVAALLLVKRRYRHSSLG